MGKKNYATDVGADQEKLAAMVALQKTMEIQSNGGLAGAYITAGYLGEYDMIGMLANKPEYEQQAGYILYDNDKGDAVFVNKE